MILLAALGALATWAGWTMADRLGIADGRPAASALDLAVTDAVDAAPPAPVAPTAPALLARPWALVREQVPAPAAEIALLVSIPFRPSASLGQMAGAIARLAWFVAVWSILGTAIARYRLRDLRGGDRVRGGSEE